MNYTYYNFDLRRAPDVQPVLMICKHPECRVTFAKKRKNNSGYCTRNCQSRDSVRRWREKHQNQEVLQWT